MSTSSDRKTAAAIDAAQAGAAPTASSVPFSPVELIRRKREGGALSADELAQLVTAYTAGEMADYQMAAFLMAVLWRGMDAAETVALTLAMADSGEQLRIRERVSPVADKHSTGGVGDKVTLIVAPLVAACGLSVAKMSGRGLGHTGGTIDKLEAITGLRTELNSEEFETQLAREGLVIAAQSNDLAPADGKMYALRDVTATVDSIPLIAASIMSKKLAIGTSHLLLDVKVGSGAFMKTREDARRLAETMVAIGEDAGVRTVALLTAMEQPLGRAVGNALEIAETIEVLRGGGPEELRTLCLHEVATLLVMAGLAADEAEGEALAREALVSGAGLAKLRAMVEAQGGDARQIDKPERLPQAPYRGMLEAPRAGYIAAIDAERVGRASVRLGAGRMRKGEAIDPAVGFVLQAKVGEHVEAGEPLIEIHAHSNAEAEAIRTELLAAYTWSDESVSPAPLLLDIVTRRSRVDGSHSLRTDVSMEAGTAHEANGANGANGAKSATHTPVGEQSTPEDEVRAIFAACDRFLTGHGRMRPREALAALSLEAGEDEAPDIYGRGALIEDFEREIATLLGKEAAVFLPSGTMAQQIALRIWSERRGCQTVAFHPTCHLELHEEKGYARLHGLHGRLVGEAQRLIALADLKAISEPVAALLLELPQREIGGQLPQWDELVRQTTWARERGAAVHMDGARLWESAPYYGRGYAEIAGLFDSVYVSFYKGVGALAGAALTGSADFIAEARVWQRRHGGNLIQLYPYVLSARAGLRARLPRFAHYHERAKGIAAALRTLAGLTILPDPPQTHMMHVYLHAPKERLMEAAIRLARAEHVALFRGLAGTELPGYSKLELSVGDAADALSDDEIRRYFVRILDEARSSDG
ncbi:MAG TPA: thymidine phosphorylase [Ktedonobacterales bacterium]